jgi:hypothetical protein
MKCLFCAVAILMAIPMFAQSQPIKVAILAGNSGQESRDVADKLVGRIGSSSRHALLKSFWAVRPPSPMDSASPNPSTTPTTSSN